MKWATVIVSRGKLEAAQQVPSCRGARLESPGHLFVSFLVEA